MLSKGKSDLTREQPDGEQADTALLIIDMLTDFEFEDGEQLYENALPAAIKIAQLKQRVVAKGFPVIYVNDNYGKWQEDMHQQIERIERSSEKGREILKYVRPSAEDYYILKPQRSAFYETPMEVLLSRLGVSKLIFTGVTTDICVLFSAHDAYMRGFKVAVPPPTTAAVKMYHRDEALAFMERVAEADIR